MLHLAVSVLVAQSVVLLSLWQEGREKKVRARQLHLKLPHMLIFRVPAWSGLILQLFQRARKIDFPFCSKKLVSMIFAKCIHSVIYGHLTFYGMKGLPGLCDQSQKFAGLSNHSVRLTEGHKKKRLFNYLGRKKTYTCTLIPNFRSLCGTQVPLEKALCPRLNNFEWQKKAVSSEKLQKRCLFTKLPLFNAFTSLKASYYSYPTSQDILFSYNSNTIHEAKKAFIKKLFRPLLFLCTTQAHCSTLLLLDPDTYIPTCPEYTFCSCGFSTNLMKE